MADEMGTQSGLPPCAAASSRGFTCSLANGHEGPHYYANPPRPNAATWPIVSFTGPSTIIGVRLPTGLRIDFAEPITLGNGDVLTIDTLARTMDVTIKRSVYHLARTTTLDWGSPSVAEMVVLHGH